MKKVIPSGITFLSLLCGTAALLQFLDGNILTGFYYSLVSIGLDVLDGYSARKLDACTKFGKVFDLIVDYFVFGIFFMPLLWRLYSDNEWAVAVIMLFVVCLTIRVSISLSGRRTKNKGMPDTVIPAILFVSYYFGINLLSVSAVLAILMVIPVRIPKLSESLTKAR